MPWCVMSPASNRPRSMRLRKPIRKKKMCTITTPTAINPDRRIPPGTRPRRLCARCCKRSAVAINKGRSGGVMIALRHVVNHVATYHPFASPHRQRRARPASMGHDARSPITNESESGSCSVGVTRMRPCLSADRQVFSQRIACTPQPSTVRALFARCCPLPYSPSRRLRPRCSQRAHTYSTPSFLLGSAFADNLRGTCSECATRPRAAAPWPLQDRSCEFSGQRGAQSPRVPASSTPVGPPPIRTKVTTPRASPRQARAQRARTQSKYDVESQVHRQAS